MFPLTFSHSSRLSPAAAGRAAEAELVPVPVPAADRDGAQGPAGTDAGRVLLHPQQQQPEQNVLAVREEPLAQVPGADHHDRRHRRHDSEEPAAQSSAGGARGAV